MPQFMRDRESLGVRPGTKAFSDVGRTVGSLARAELLPAFLDPQGIVPRREGENVQAFGHARRVPDHNLWVWYQVSGTEVIILGLTAQLTER
jgi:hypothetical protein